MPMPASDARAELHVRQIEMRGYRRPDGLFEVEGRLTDRKAVSPDGAAKPFLHDMSIRLVVDSDLVVQDVIASSDSAPYDTCSEASATLGMLKGVSIVSGWRKAIAQRLGRRKSCSHLRELLSSLGATAFLTLSEERKKKPEKLDKHGRPVKIDSCYSYASDRGLVMTRWPAFYTGKAASR